MSDGRGRNFFPCVDVALVSHARTWGTKGIPAPLHGPTLIIPAPRALIVVVVKPPCLNELDRQRRAEGDEPQGEDLSKEYEDVT